MSCRDLLFAVLCVLLTLICALSIWLRLQCTYWERLRMPHIKPLPGLGNIADLLLLRISFGELFRQFYAAPAHEDAPVVGFHVFQTPALVIREPQLIRAILIKNFHMFPNRYEAADPHHDEFGSLTLPLAKYPVWRVCRNKIAEFFTSGHLKYSVYPQIWDIAMELNDYIANCCSSSGVLTARTAVIEVKEMCALFTTDVTALVAFSMRLQSLRIGHSEMRTQCRKLLAPSPLKALHFLSVFFLPKLNWLFRAKVFTAVYVDFIRQFVEKAIAKRPHAATPTADLIDLLVAFKKASARANLNTFTQHTDFIASQVAIFLLAGFETTSSLIAFALYELAKEPTVQHRLRKEIRESLQEEDRKTLSYETLNGLQYLGMVVQEVLRLYPAAAFINREFTPLVKGARFSLRPFVDFDMPYGMPAYISILGLHRDPKYWPNPNCFMPERFAPDVIQLIQPMTYIPFGAGPHGCVGSRLGLLQLKIGLVQILLIYKVQICPLTVPLIEFDPKSFMLQSKGGIYLKFVYDP